MFLVKVIIISCTGALSPGPLTAATAAIGVKHGWRGGFFVGLGHMLFEFPLVILIGLGIATVFTSKMFSQALSFIGGIFLLIFSYLTLKDAIKVKSITARDFKKSPVLIGIGFSALNPFFITWWIGIGAPLIFEAINYWGLGGLIPFYIAHVWLDFAWLSLVAHITSISGLKLNVYRVILALIAILVALFGLDFLYYSLMGRHLMPF